MTAASERQKIEGDNRIFFSFGFVFSFSLWPHHYGFYYHQYRMLLVSYIYILFAMWSN